MEYRKLPKGDEKISVFGLGSSSLGPAGAKETDATIAMALENGINYFDMAAGDASPFAAYGRAVAGAREKVFFQVHFGADYRSGKYGWTLEPDEIKRSVDWQLKMLQTDYIDFGFIHCIDEEEDLQAVLTVLPGVRNREDLKRILGFFDAPAADKDYSVLAEFEPAKADGVCVYCNHCAPCPAGLDIGLINKYFDLANAGDTLAKDHYLHLGKQAGDCIGCGHCDRRCPFHVHQSARMQEIRTYFGR